MLTNKMPPLSEAVNATGKRSKLEKFSSGAPNLVATSILLLGVTVNGHSFNDITTAQQRALDEVSAVLDKPCVELGLDDWRDHSWFRGSHAGFLILGAFLQEAVPVRVEKLWGRFLKPALRQRHLDRTGSVT